MKKFSLLTFYFLSFLIGFQLIHGQKNSMLKETKVRNIIYFNPEVFPDIEEIKEPTYSAFFSSVSDHLVTIRNYKMLRVDTNIPYDTIDANLVKEFCFNNNAQLAVIPKVKYFKVGIGKYVFSNQVIVSMKLFDAEGNFLTESSYDTFRKNARLLGSAENSIKIGTKGVMKSINKNLRKHSKSELSMVYN